MKLWNKSYLTYTVLFAVSVFSLLSGAMIVSLVLSNETFFVSLAAEDAVLLSGLTLIMSMLISACLYWWIKKTYQTPIAKVSEVMDKINDTYDLTLRLDENASHPLKPLFNNFNEMLSIIYDRHLELEIVYQELMLESDKAEQVSRELEKRNEQIKQMLSGAAHDLRQPLQAITLFIETLSVKNQDTSITPIITKLHRAASNLDSLFTDILDVSKIENYQRDRSLERTNIQNIIQSLQTEYATLGKKKNIDFRVNGKPIEIWSVPRILERILRNIVGNAMNYTDDGGVLITYRARKEHVEIAVYDTGSGISEENLSKIFTQFDRAGRESQERSGYGLGLAIVKQFSEFLGYSIRVNSNLGRGSCFKIIIPSRFVFDESVTMPEENHSAGDGDDQSEYYDYDHLQLLLEQTNIFFIDDESDIRHAFSELCRSWGMGVEVFSCVDDIHTYFASEDFLDPDIVISDYQLAKGETGDEAIEEIRLLSGINVPAFIVTGNRSNKILKDIESKGFEYLLKPFEPKKIKSKIESLLS